MKIDPGKICGPCQMGKQIRSSHKMMQHFSTIRVLELIHMDLIEPMQLGSLGDKGMHLFVLMIFPDIRR